MRRLFTLALAASAVALLPACGLILGSFTTEGGGGSKDGGSDGSGDTNVGDAKLPAKLTCQSTGPLLDLGVNPDWIRTGTEGTIAVHSAISGGPRIAVQNWNAGTLEIGGIDKAGKFSPIGSATPTNFRLARFTNFDQGFAAIGTYFDTGANKNYLEAYALLDSSSTAGPAQQLDSLPPNGNTQFSALIVPVEPAQGKYFVAYTYEDDPTTHPIRAGLITLPGGGVPALVETTKARPNLDPNGVYIDRAAGIASIFFTLGQGGGGPLHVVDVKLDGSALGPERPVQTPPAGIFFLPTFATSSGPQTTNNGCAFGQGDPQNASIPIGMRVSVCPDSNRANFDPNTLPPLIPLKATELAVDHSMPLWQFFPGGPQLVVGARLTQFGKGVNLNWFDGKTSTLRMALSGANAIAQADDVITAAASLDQGPTDISASLTSVWLTSSGNMRGQRIACLAQ